MFDVDGTLVQSFKFDEECYLSAVSEVLGHPFTPDWSEYPHISDSGILRTYLQKLGQMHRHDEIYQQVKALFVDKIRRYLESNPAAEIPGARAFFSSLRERQDINLSIATGGWSETALLKLASAKIDVDGIPIASSNDHHVRSQIMISAASKANIAKGQSFTYFGDAEWDKLACAELGCKFILVGRRIEHDSQVDDFDSSTVVNKLLGI